MKHTHQHGHQFPHPHAIGYTVAAQHAHEHEHGSIRQAQLVGGEDWGPIHRLHRHTPIEDADLRIKRLGLAGIRNP